MTNEELVANYSGIPEDITYVADLFANEAEEELQELAQEVCTALNHFKRALDDIGFELG